MCQCIPYYQQLYCFLYFCFFVPDVKPTILIPQSKRLICTRHSSKLSQVFLSNISYEYVILCFTIIIIVIGCYEWKCGNVIAFGNFLIPSLIGFNSLTRPFKSFLHVCNWFEEFKKFVLCAQVTYTF